MPSKHSRQAGSPAVARLVCSKTSQANHGSFDLLDLLKPAGCHPMFSILQTEFG
jgi:hypothetical protein